MFSHEVRKIYNYLQFRLKSCFKNGFLRFMFQNVAFPTVRQFDRSPPPPHTGVQIKHEHFKHGFIPCMNFCIFIIFRNINFILFFALFIILDRVFEKKNF